MEREPRAEKVSVVDDVRERFEDAEAVLITEYRGLSVSEIAELRSALRDAGTTYKIYKNTLVRLAIEDNAPDGMHQMLVGPTALAFVEKDPSAAAKALKTFASNNDALVIKGAILSGGLLDEAQVRELAELPSRDELLASIAGGLAAPLQSIASMMNNLLSEVSGLLQALSDKGGATKDSGASEQSDDSEVAEIESAVTSAETENVMNETSDETEITGKETEPVAEEQSDGDEATEED
jgi:large subunit ribosomal protein L10